MYVSVCVISNYKKIANEEASDVQITDAGGKDTWKNIHQIQLIRFSFSFLLLELASVPLLFLPKQLSTSFSLLNSFYCIILKVKLKREREKEVKRA